MSAVVWLCELFMSVLFGSVMENTRSNFSSGFAELRRGYSGGFLIKQCYWLNFDGVSVLIIVRNDLNATC